MSDVISPIAATNHTKTRFPYTSSSLFGLAELGIPPRSEFLTDSGWAEKLLTHGASMASALPALQRRCFQLPSAVRYIALPVNRSFSVLNRPLPHYEGHVPLTRVENSALAVGSAVMSLLNPRRGGN